jgi:hypothetical protein
MAVPSCSGEIPDDCWKPANESTRGDVRTPPKSLITAVTLLTGPA